MSQATRDAGASINVRIPPGPDRWPGRLAKGLPAVSALLATVWVYRTVLFGAQLPGNIGDARWTIALHEHWFRVWSGRDAIRDLQYYYPLPKTLGTSETFFVQGQFYSLARLLGFDLVNSWVIAGFLFFLVGALGTAVLARQVLDTVWRQTALVVLIVASYPVLVTFGQIQSFGMLAVSWVFVGLHDLASRRHVRRGFALLAVVPPLLALSSWYAMVLAAIVFAVLGATVCLVSSAAAIAATVRRVAADAARILWSPVGCGVVVVSAGLWVGTLWIYLPSRGLLPAPNWGDVELLGPRWSDVLNASGGGGGVWSWLYARMPGLAQSGYEQQRGLTPILFATFTLCAAVLLRLAVIGQRQQPAPPDNGDGGPARDYGVWRSGLLAGCLAVALVIALILIDERGLSLFRLMWFHLPGLESIRAPFRVMAILYGIVLFVVLRSIELADRDWAWLAGGSWRRLAYTVASVGLVLALLFEMQRPPDASWTRDDLLPATLAAQVEPARENCDAVIVLNEYPPDTPAWLNPVDAVVFATVVGLPTPQGYSRADPTTYPGPVGGGDGGTLAQWMRDQGFEGRVCAVSSRGVEVLPS